MFRNDDYKMRILIFYIHLMIFFFSLISLCCGAAGVVPLKCGPFCVVCRVDISIIVKSRLIEKWKPNSVRANKTTRKHCSWCLCVFRTPFVAFVPSPPPQKHHDVEAGYSIRPVLPFPEPTKPPMINLYSRCCWLNHSAIPSLNWFIMINQQPLITHQKSQRVKCDKRNAISEWKLYSIDSKFN